MASERKMITSISGSTVEDISQESGVPGLRLVHNEALERFLFDRNLVGLGFRRACLEASSYFVSHLLDEGLEDCSELLILSKGVAYQMASAFADVANLNLPCNLIATSRVAASDEGAKIDVTYSRFDAGGSTLILGDTIASGATITTALGEYQKFHTLDRVIIVSFAGSLVGARHVHEYCARNGIETLFLFGLAAFGLAPNGFDLSFLHPDTICRDGYKQRAENQFAGNPVSAVGWDFGSQTMAPEKYRSLCWLEANRWGLLESPALRLARKPTDMSVVAHEAIALREDEES